MTAPPPARDTPSPKQESVGREIEPGRPNGPRLGALDGLRFLCALAVVSYHYTVRREVDASRWPDLRDVTQYGALGVQVFFLISGFVIMATAWNADLPKFIASRVSRLFPAYWVAVVLVALIAPPHSLTGPNGWQTVAVNLTMTQQAFDVPPTVTVAWTLFNELMFYLLIAVLIRIGLTRGRVLALCLLWPFIAQIGAHHPEVALLMQPAYAPLFCAGIVIYLIYREGFSTVLVTLLGYELALIAWQSKLTYAPQLLVRPGMHAASPTIVFVLIVSAILLLIVISRTRIAGWHTRWITFAGALTYPLYLIHEQIGWRAIDALVAHGLGGRESAVLVAVGAIGLAATIHLLVERPLAPRLRRRLDAGLRRT